MRRRFSTISAILVLASAPAFGAQQPLPSGPMTRYSGNPLLRNGPESDDYWKTGPRVVLKEGPATYRIWYEAVGSDLITRVGYATSADGLQWTKQGTVISPSQAWEMEEVSPNSILFENGVYKMWYHGGGYIRSSQRLGYGRIGYATSSDGIMWTKYAGNPVLDIGPPGSIDDQQVAEPRVLKIGTAYRMYYTGASSTTSLCMATSADGVAWTKYSGNPILYAAAWGGFWGGAFFNENGIWHLWHAKTPSGLYYKWSTDGITWTDGPSNPVLTTSSDPSAADAELVGDSVSGYRDGNTYRIMYTGYNSNLFGSLGRFEGICMAMVDDPNPPLGDSDGDGLPDAWEMTYFGNLNQGASGDPDADGLSNLQEYTLGTNPAVGDTDGDGLPDGLEVNTYGTSPTTVDTDGDGMTDGFEVANGFNPLVSDQDGNGLPDGQDDWDGDGTPNQSDSTPGSPPGPGGGGGGSGGCGATGFEPLALVALLFLIRRRS